MMESRPDSFGESHNNRGITKQRFRNKRRNSENCKDQCNPETDSVTRVLSILLITAATSASVHRANSKERVSKALGSRPAGSCAQR